MNLKRFLQNFLIFAFTGTFFILLTVGVLRIRTQNIQDAITPKTSPSPTPSSASPSAPAPSSFQPVTETPAQVAAPSQPQTNAPAPPAPAPAPTPAKTASRTVTGDTYTIPWGDVTAAITVQNGKITDVTMPDVPYSPPSQYAKDVLINQAIAAGSANIQGVSGATYTSLAFKRSLESAIAKAGI